MTMNEVLDIIESEGLGYAIQSYMHGDKIGDPTLAKMWSAAGLMLDAIEEYVAHRSTPADERDSA